MISDETERRDWIIGIVVTAVIIGGLYWIRSQPIEEKAAASVPVEPPPEHYQSDSYYEQDALIDEERVITTRRSSPSTIGRVFECEQDGQRVLSDQPCGADATILDIPAPNRMQAQDTSVLYEPLPRSIQVQKRRAAGQVPNVRPNQERCDAIDKAKKQINAQMRRGYRSGEHYRERLRRLSAERWELGCGRNDEVR